jgi:hypothetical protein
MVDEGSDLVLEHLRHIRRAVDETRLDMIDMKARMSGVEASLGRIQIQLGMLVSGSIESRNV